MMIVCSRKNCRRVIPPTESWFKVGDQSLCSGCIAEASKPKKPVIRDMQAEGVGLNAAQQQLRAHA